ncbi:MAG: hypothetical protein AAF851_00995 [Myxococcota bacterium]
MALTCPAAATTVQPLDLQQRFDGSRLVALAQVASVRSWRPAERSGVVSEITLKPIQILKGEHRGPILVQRAGGEAEGLRTWADGLYDYQVGEEVLLFLVPYGGRWVAIGVGMGTLPARTRKNLRQVWWKGGWRAIDQLLVDWKVPEGEALTPPSSTIPGATGTPAPAR